MPLITITAPGVYAITNDYTSVSAADDAIVVAPNVHNVTILLYSRLACLSTLPTNRQNCGIRMHKNNACQIIGMGGTIRGFGFGLRADDCDNLRISHLTVPDALMRGVMISGPNAFVKDCLIQNIHGSTFTPKQYCFGIEVSGAKPKILDNTVENFYGTADGTGDNGEGVGISCSDQGVGAVIKGNACRNSTKQPKSYGYWMGGTFDGVFCHNMAQNMYRGAAASSPTMGHAEQNVYYQCDEDFVEMEGDWSIGFAA